MLTDIFAYRYKDTPLWDNITEAHSRALIQGFRLVSEDLYPYWVDGSASAANKRKWELFDKKLSTELGTMHLSATHVGTYPYTPQQICENFYMVPLNGLLPDIYIKQRISFLEIAFQEKYKDLKAEEVLVKTPVRVSQAPPPLSGKSFRRETGIRLPGNAEDGKKAYLKSKADLYLNLVDEVNTRFRQAKLELNLHNGLIQRSNDGLTSTNVERPFWNVLSDKMWENVDFDMKTAIDLRDSGSRDPASYAAKALESTIKIISKNRGWDTGHENGAINFLDNLLSAKNGSFISQWEHTIIKNFFSSVRNPLGHGPGTAPMPSLSKQQTDWAIEFCMGWIKNLALRFY